MKKLLLIIVSLILVSSAIFAAGNDYQTLRTFMSAQMYGEAYYELMQRELTGLKLDNKLRSLKIDLLDRTNEKLKKQAKMSPDDATVFTILADIAFQRGDFDNASNYISKAIANNGKAISNYTFAKILFQKGNYKQAFEQISIVLQAMPESIVAFNDFQFLYNCKEHGVNTAKKITKDFSFIDRATPIDYEKDKLEVPQSPFDNDPTKTANPPDFSDYNKIAQKVDQRYETDEEDDDLDELSQIDIDSEKKDEEEGEENEEENEEIARTEETESDDKTQIVDNDKKEVNDNTKNLSLKEKKDDFEIDDFDVKQEEPEKKIVIKETENQDDPELKKLEADNLFASAQTKFKDNNIESALSNLKELDKISPDYPGKKELENKINYKVDLRKRYKESRKEFEEEGFDNYEGVRKIFQEAYSYDPKEFYDAPYYIGICYAQKEDPDFDQALKYYDMIIDDLDSNSEMRRDLLWRKLIILYDQKEDYEKASEIFDYFVNNEEDYAKNQLEFNQFRYGIWWHLYKTYIIIVFVVVFLLVIFVTALQFLPDLKSIISGDPLPSAEKAFKSHNLRKAIKVAEKALKKTQPIQIDRQLREILVQAYFALKDYQNCQIHAKAILKNFPENQIAWGHLARASIETQDSSNEAIRMYEELYRSDPTRKDLLPMLAKSYITNKDTSQAAMEIMLEYYAIKPDDADVIIALADGYVKNRTMGQEIIPILNDALKLKDKIEYRELLARTFSKCGLYEEAARECVNVLRKNISNIGIHVVYTSSMKKLNQLPRAIAQYKDFISENPGNNQLAEILDGLKKEARDSSTVVDDIPPIIDSLGMPGMDDVDSGLPSMPDLDKSNTNNSPSMPNFMTNTDNLSQQNDSSISSDQTVENNSEPSSNQLNDNNDEQFSAQPIENSSNSDGTSDLNFPNVAETLPTLDPFADNDTLLSENDSLFDGFDTDELPEELGGTARTPIEPSSNLDNVINGLTSETSNNSIEDYNIAPEPIQTNTPEVAPKTGTLELQGKIDKAKDYVSAKEYNSAIELLSPEFATVRNREVGKVLIDAWLGNNNPGMALDIIHALDIDPEMMSEDIKDIVYRTAEALENNKSYSDALKLYDLICNADINFRDAFDRSDRLYVKIRG